jgi:hypothetical protein
MRRWIFGEAIGTIGGVRQKLHIFFMDLPHSDAPVIKAHPAETTEACLHGHVSAFAFFGGRSETGQAGVPQSILYDNTKLAVARIPRDGTRTQAFTALVSHYLFRDRFGRPGKGSDKGKVEGLVKNGRQRFLTPVPSAPSYDEPNARPEAHCREEWERRARRRTKTIGERVRPDLTVFRALPEGHFEACEKCTARVSSTLQIRYRLNDDSVPIDYGYRDIIVKGFVDEVVILCGADEIARHKRSYGRADFISDPRHYLALIEQKPGALDQAAALQGWPLSPAFPDLRRMLETRMGHRGKREFIQVLRLMETFLEAIVATAADDAIGLGAPCFDAVKQLLIAHVKHHTPRPDTSLYPYRPKPTVATTRAADYRALLSVGCEWATESASKTETAA